jgi:hypothetical protein
VSSKSDGLSIQMLAEYKIILIEDKLKNLLPGNPFNLKNDFKNIDIKLKDLIIQEVVDQLHK